MPLQYQVWHSFLPEIWMFLNKHFSRATYFTMSNDKLPSFQKKSTHSWSFWPHWSNTKHNQSTHTWAPIMREHMEIRVRTFLVYFTQIVIWSAKLMSFLLTLISETPSVSRIHSWICLNSPSSVMVTLFLFSSFGKFMYTLDMASMPCRVMSVSMFASMHLKNTSSSILSSCSSS